MPGTQVGFDASPIDIDILKQLQDHEIDVDYARKCLEANKHNTVTATYYLILKKHLKAGGESIADARKPTYNPDVFLKRIPNLKNLLQKKDGETVVVPEVEKKQSSQPKPAIESKAQIKQSPSLNLNNSSSPGILSPSIRGSSQPPVAKNVNVSLN